MPHRTSGKRAEACRLNNHGKKQRKQSGHPYVDLMANNPAPDVMQSVHTFSFYLDLDGAHCTINELMIPLR
jgi:hypothetical protein